MCIHLDFSTDSKVGKKRGWFPLLFCTWVPSPHHASPSLPSGDHLHSCAQPFAGVWRFTYQAREPWTWAEALEQCLRQVTASQIWQREKIAATTLKRRGWKGDRRGRWRHRYWGKTNFAFKKCLQQLLLSGSKGIYLGAARLLDLDKVINEPFPVGSILEPRRG